MASGLALKIKLLGHFEAWRNDELLGKDAWPQPKVQTLLKVLLVERGQVYSHDQLIEALFADLDPSKATINLQRRISELRAVLEPHLKKRTESQYILRLGQGYCFNKEADCWIDVEAFERLVSTAKASETDGIWHEALEVYEQAIDLYQGDYLTDNLYEDWSLDPRERWRNELLNVLARSAECHARLGDYENAIERCQQAISIDCYRETNYRSLMIYYWRAGEQSKVSQVYQDCSDTMEELRAQPSLETKTLFEKIQQGYVSALEQIYPAPDMAKQPASSFVMPGIKSIAVLPFVNMDSELDEYDHFTDGIMEDTLTQLSKLGNLKVISRTSSMQYKSTNKSLLEIGKELGVATILEGSVRRTDTQVRVVAQLINAKTDDHIWADTFDWEMTNIFEIQNDVAQEIAKALKIWVSPFEEQRVQQTTTENSEAYNLFLLGRFHWDKFTKEGFEASIQYFNQAIEHDPNYALAHARLAFSYGILVEFGLVTPEEGFSKANEAVQKALKIDDSLSEAHAAQGFLKMHEWDWASAERELRTAISLNPNAFTPHNLYGNLLTFMGRFDEAIAEKEIAYKFDPLHLRTNFDLGRAYFYAGQNDKAIQVYKRLIEMSSSFFMAHLALGVVYLQESRYEDALKEFEKEQALPGKWNPSLDLAMAYLKHKTGDVTALQNALDHLLEKSQQESISPTYFALTYSLLGEDQQAMKWLKKAIEQRDTLLWDFKVSPLTKKVWSDPSYSSILTRVGFIE